MTLIDSTPAQIRTACDAAAHAGPAWAALPITQRAAHLTTLADALQAARDTLVPLADEETGLGAARLNGELDRTAFQLRGFAEQLLAGRAQPVQDDAAVPGAPPAGRPRLTRVATPLGPVANFAASNFPFAFSVLGGDTAAALAAGCTVVVKAHPGHPQLSRAVFELGTGLLPAGVLQMVQGAGIDVGVSLVRDEAIAAATFTGSVRGGVALWKEANARPRPIPFYGELGSVNPVVALPEALAANGAALATQLAGSITLGCGQFCTSPGIVIVRDDEASQAFVKQLAEGLAAANPHAMLNAGIRAGFNAGVARLHGRTGVKSLLALPAREAAPGAHLFATDAASFLADEVLHEEVFGPSCIVVTVRDLDETLRVLQAVQGTLTVTLWGADADTPDNRRLIAGAQAIAGRVLFAGVPTGVAVTAAQQHGGPWPSSTNAFSTSVGYAAMERFLRPVALQDAPAWLIEARGQA
ncbi:aldehyde dehydrogenase (NADP(+)) [Roseateles asaccharophilus]|uniref:NADP-dependent aldehyde dehydrogenase n=1 Tax=Roseateles asaccharophilus TaxID=582607 RepID=A0ABU2A210_9BURK|nr:aldehyde dehydrogenase (NADP(+)) [Roseateles asaccharophilus]MDR7331232.1 NADP-dependent aldehyde dehydrogenase [Roseateles asaccharophilus]